MNTPASILSGNSYPGRGVLIGMTPDAANIAVAYFIMGRSENSRNRVFALDGDGIRTQAFDESKMTDPSLIIYHPVRVLGGQTVVTNGDQTDTIYDALKHGQTFAQALRTRTFEPDKPNYTPRISGLVTLTDTGVSYQLSILKSANGNPDSTQRFFYEYDEPVPGEGQLIHTYAHDGNPIPSFCGEPHTVQIAGDLKSFGNEIWQALDPDNKVSLFTRFIRIDTGVHETRIINKNY